MFILYYTVVLKLTLTVSICKVVDSEIQTYQTVNILKWVTIVEFTTISPILYIHC